MAIKGNYSVWHRNDSVGYEKDEDYQVRLIVLKDAIKENNSHHDDPIGYEKHEHYQANPIAIKGNYLVWHLDDSIGYEKDEHYQVILIVLRDDIKGNYSHLDEPIGYGSGNEHG